MFDTHGARSRRRPFRLLTGSAIAALVAGGAVLVPQAASAAAPFPDTQLYATVSGSATIYAVDRTTGAATPALTSPGNVTGLNQIGISGDGDKLILTNSTNVYEYTASTSSWDTVLRSTAPSVANQMGGVDPKSGRFFFGGQVSGVPTQFTFTSYDPTTNTIAQSPVSVSVSNAPGGNGDLAFDRQGNLYFVSSSASSAQLYRVDAAALGGGSTTATPVGPTITPAAALTSLAFGDDGYLYIAGSGANTFLQVNPVTGATVAQRTIAENGTSLTVTDLGSRAVPSTGQSGGGFTDGRAKPGDELTTTIGGGGITSNNTATTAPGKDTVTVGPIILLPGDSYTVTQTPGNAGTDPNAYDTSYVCTNLVDNSVVSSGKGTTAPFTVPAAGGDVRCVFSNPLKPVVKDTSSTGNTAGQPATVDPLQGSVGDIDPKTVELTSNGPGSTVSDGGKTLTVPGQGVWTVDPNTGAVTFTPEAGFTKNPTPVTYTVDDTRGNQTEGKVSVTYTGSAQSDTGTTDQGAPTTIGVLDNDKGGTVASSVVFPTAGQPSGATVSNGGKTLTVPGEGVYTIDPTTGAVTFTPDPAFRGTASSVTYQVADAEGATTTAPITVTVNAVSPRAVNDTASTGQNTPVTVDVVGNDKPGVDNGTPLDRKSVVFPTAGQPTGATVSDGGKKLTVPGEGVYTTDPDTGKVTFAPAQGFTGTATAVTYQVADTGGKTATATLTVTVDPVSPTAAPATGSVTQGGSVTVDELSKDTPGNAATPLDPKSVIFPTAGQPVGATVSDGGKKLTVPGQGVYTIDPDTGKITFAADPAFRGTASPVTYQVADVDGSTASSTVTITVDAAAPAAVADTDTTPQNTPVGVAVLGNDKPGVENGTPLDPTSVVFTVADQPVGATVTDGGRTLTVPGQGVYTVAPATGVVTFTPQQGYAGTASAVTYQVSDTGGQTATATITITVTPVAPTAHDDSAQTPRDTPVTVAVLGNDTAGNAATPIDATKTRLLDAGRNPVTDLK
ncbi:tandem-95 repeat protein, partial [uncultured Microbacterium sp.]|uniref:tandem-95 repeat protein n=1 Tax=uncultured Microbacterium sp. TaxID=191216 RepID=UPI0025EFC9B1